MLGYSIGAVGPVAPYELTSELHYPNLPWNGEKNHQGKDKKKKHY